MSTVLGLKGRAPGPDEPRHRTAHYAWRPAGWFGLLFVIIGFSDMALVWYPLRPGNPSWEFGAVDLTFSSLPILAIGLGACLVAALARGRARLAGFFAVVSILLGLLCIMAYLLFLSDVPLALRNSPPEVLTGVKKAIYRTSLFGVAFTSAFLGAGIAVLRHLRAVRREGIHG